MKRGGLGRGLSALIPGAPEEGGSGMLEIPVSAIVPNPRQPRNKFDDEDLEGLVVGDAEAGAGKDEVLDQFDGRLVKDGRLDLRLEERQGLGDAAGSDGCWRWIVATCDGGSKSDSASAAWRETTCASMSRTPPPAHRPG